MSYESPEYLRAIIHRVLDDTAQPFITRAVLCASGAGVSPAVLATLREWQDGGYLRILMDPDRARDSEPIVEMLRYIENKSPIPGFLNWE